MSPAAYLAALDSILIRLIRLMVPIISTMLRSGLSESTRARRIEVAARQIIPIMRYVRQLVADLTADYLRGQAEAQIGQDDPLIPPLSGYSDDAVRSVLELAVDERLSGRRRSVVTDEAALDFSRHAAQAGRQMIEDAVEPVDATDDDTAEEQERDDADEPDTGPTDDEIVPDKPTPPPSDTARDLRRPVAWARGLTGADNCAFCIMLASRGAVYKSKQTASRSWEGKKYHRRCDCVPIPIYSSKEFYASPEGQQADRAYKFWLATTGKYDGLGKLNAFRRALDARARLGKKPYPGFKGIRPAK
jgi:hypothetical protein